MFKNEGGGVKGRLNNVQKNRRFGPAGRPLLWTTVTGTDQEEVVQQWTSPVELLRLRQEDFTQ